MAAASHTMSSAKFLPLPCSRCGAWEVQRKPRALFHKLSAIDPYVCARCGKRKNQIRLTPGTFIGFFLCVALMGATVYLSREGVLFQRGQETSHNASEALALTLARSSAGALSPFEQMMIKKPRTSMDNAVVLQLWRAEVDPDIILQLIRTSSAGYDLSPRSVIELKQAGVQKAIILAMIDASYNTR
jgi:hypothetical protein